MISHLQKSGQRRHVLGTVAVFLTIFLSLTSCSRECYNCNQAECRSGEGHPEKCVNKAAICAVWTWKKDSPKYHAKAGEVYKKQCAMLLVAMEGCRGDGNYERCMCNENLCNINKLKTVFMHETTTTPKHVSESTHHDASTHADGNLRNITTTTKAVSTSVTESSSTHLTGGVISGIPITGKTFLAVGVPGVRPASSNSNSSNASFPKSNSLEDDNEYSFEMAVEIADATPTSKKHNNALATKGLNSATTSMEAKAVTMKETSTQANALDAISTKSNPVETSMQSTISERGTTDVFVTGTTYIGFFETISTEAIVQGTSTEGSTLDTYSDSAKVSERNKTLPEMWSERSMQDTSPESVRLGTSREFDMLKTSTETITLIVSSETSTPEVSSKISTQEVSLETITLKASSETGMTDATPETTTQEASPDTIKVFTDITTLKASEETITPRVFQETASWETQSETSTLESYRETDTLEPSLETRTKDKIYLEARSLEAPQEFDTLKASTETTTLKASSETTTLEASSETSAPEMSIASGILGAFSETVTQETSPQTSSSETNTPEVTTETSFMEVTPEKTTFEASLEIGNLELSSETGLLVASPETRTPEVSSESSPMTVSTDTTTLEAASETDNLETSQETITLQVSLETNKQQASTQTTPEATTLGPSPETGMKDTISLEASREFDALTAFPEATKLDAYPETATLKLLTKIRTLEAFPESTMLEVSPETNTPEMLLETALETSTESGILEASPETVTLETIPLMVSQKTTTALESSREVRTMERISTVAITTATEPSTIDIVTSYISTMGMLPYEMSTLETLSTMPTLVRPDRLSEESGAETLVKLHTSEAKFMVTTTFEETSEEPFFQEFATGLSHNEFTSRKELGADITYSTAETNSFENGILTTPPTVKSIAIGPNYPSTMEDTTFEASSTVPSTLISNNDITTEPATTSTRLSTISIPSRNTASITPTETTKTSLIPVSSENMPPLNEEVNKTVIIFPPSLKSNSSGLRCSCAVKWVTDTNINSLSHMTIKQMCSPFCKFCCVLCCACVQNKYFMKHIFKAK